MKRVRVGDDNWNFVLEGDGTPIVPLGGNVLDSQHPAQGTLFDDFDADDCDRRLGIMADLGLNCLRQPIGVNQVFDPVSGLRPVGMKNWDTFIGLAEKHGIYLMPVGGYIGGNDWFDCELLVDNGKALDESCDFWEAFAGHYTGHPAIWAWDLRNELLYNTESHAIGPGAPDAQQLEAALKDQWPNWLQARYSTVEEMNRVYGTDHGSFDKAPGSVKFVEKPFDPCAYDFRCYLNERGYGWCKRQCEVLRSVAADHMIVSGNNGWLSPDMDLWLANGFHNIAHQDLFDFVTFHPYPAWQCTPGGHGDPLDGGNALEFWLNACIGMARIDYYDKPVVLQEFGWYGGGESSFVGKLPYRSEGEHADYTRRLTAALIPHVNGFINWPTFDMPQSLDISNHGGIFTHDGRPKELAAVYSELSERLQGRTLERDDGNTVMEYSLAGLYTSRPYQDHMWEEINQTMAEGRIPDFLFT